MIAKVASVWIISVCVCLPLLVMGFVDRSTVYNDTACVPSAKQVRRVPVPRLSLFSCRRLLLAFLDLSVSVLVCFLKIFSLFSTF